jgi:hypothetical protein
MFVGSLYHFRNRLSIYGFVFHCRYFFNLPALVPEYRDTGEQSGLVGEAGTQTLCTLDHKDGPQTLDPTGNHATSCTSTHGARYGLHERLNRVVMAFAREAGATTHREPPTASTLLNYVCTPDQCRTMFPKQLNTRSHDVGARY